EARIWLDKEPPRSILAWEDLVLKFINQFFPPSKTTYLRNEITNFLQKPNEMFNEAWERFKDLLRQCPHHDIRMNRFEKSLNDMKASFITPTAPIKAVEEMATKIKAQDLEISNLKSRIKLLEDKDRRSAEPSGDDAPIKGRSMEIGEEAGVERSTELGSND
nr:reverse transcriptase domain-containing protein [Tanacetum cinerariifolium]